ncbi:hypothetical protein VCHA43P273_70033 [Vibrio chagasii]|nr:hypothetical protein VCHA35O135_10571 [Vibrio chagasii]CAH6870273.1 hypothetical protein VCHA29O37_240032 [Vibrio chagasii]CAH6976462.1 hypothetical protein VCHA34P120_40033 [Vibrio chagasii]CAH7025630.1 hypothetical protein VCHA36P161_60024 [Vibrio chagasii]CAH7040212.1 hypothetical protein VCHA37O173_70026 [Vibrio chagasii]
MILVTPSFCSKSEHESQITNPMSVRPLRPPIYSLFGALAGGCLVSGDHARYVTDELELLKARFLK